MWIKHEDKLYSTEGIKIIAKANSTIERFTMEGTENIVIPSIHLKDSNQRLAFLDYDTKEKRDRVFDKLVEFLNIKRSLFIAD